ncbi:hypothetical protein NEMIN01_0275 [Nematocida minor]|uniref:uncharacterized protein n=1 Tax=Nematocida minor TaxID=1912983 RepID=UPI00221EFD1D|nr:uncharacterized protein NEMIN01_0275 [Nematocida minor]KAI5189109.1 hypothetical protein NEMIN01_0275 [Nematocida minor]
MANLAQQERVAPGSRSFGSRITGCLKSVKKAGKKMASGVFAIVTVCQTDQSGEDAKEEQQFAIMRAKYTSSTREIETAHIRETENISSMKSGDFGATKTEEAASTGQPRIVSSKELAEALKNEKSKKENGAPSSSKKAAVSAEAVEKIVQEIMGGRATTLKKNRASKKDEKTLEETIRFIKDVEAIVQDESFMADASFTPILLLFYLKKEQYAITCELELAEIVFHAPVEDSAEKTSDLEDEVIEYLVAEGLEPTICISYWISCINTLEHAYGSLYRTVLGSLLDSTKAGTRTHKTIVFYNAVLKGIRNIVSVKLAQMEKLENPEFRKSEIFTDAVEKIMLSKKVIEFITHTVPFDFGNSMQSAYTLDEQEDEESSTPSIEDKEFTSSEDDCIPAEETENKNNRVLRDALHPEKISRNLTEDMIESLNYTINYLEYQEMQDIENKDDSEYTVVVETEEEESDDIVESMMGVDERVEVSDNFKSFYAGITKEIEGLNEEHCTTEVSECIELCPAIFPRDETIERVGSSEITEIILEEPQPPSIQAAEEVLASAETIEATLEDPVPPAYSEDAQEREKKKESAEASPEVAQLSKVFNDLEASPLFQKQKEKYHQL